MLTFSRVYARALLIIALAAISAIPLAASAQYTPPTLVQTLRINNANLPVKCLTPTSSGDWTVVDQVSLMYCDFAALQYWKLYGVHKNWRGHWDIFMIQQGDKCLGVKDKSSANNAHLDLQGCSASDDPSSLESRGLLWLREDAIDEDGWTLSSKTKWRNLYTSKCMDAGDRHEGIVLTQWQCAGGSWASQEFTAN